MPIAEILTAIDQQIASLQQARAILSSKTQATALTTTAPSLALVPARRPGRPKGSVNKRDSVAKSPALTPKRTMSKEGKARIAAAQKARWAAQKKAISRAGKTVAKKIGTPKKAAKAVTKPKAAKKSKAPSAASVPAANSNV